MTAADRETTEVRMEINEEHIAAAMQRLASLDRAMAASMDRLDAMERAIRALTNDLNEAEAITRAMQDALGRAAEALLDAAGGWEAGARTAAALREDRP